MGKWGTLERPMTKRSGSYYCKKCQRRHFHGKGAGTKIFNDHLSYMKAGSFQELEYHKMTPRRLKKLS